MLSSPGCESSLALGVIVKVPSFGLLVCWISCSPFRAVAVFSVGAVGSSFSCNFSSVLARRGRAIFPAAPVDSGGHSVEHLPRGARVAWGFCGCLRGLLCERPALLGSSGAFVDAGLVVGAGA